MMFEDLTDYNLELDESWTDEKEYPVFLPIYPGFQDETDRNLELSGDWMTATDDECWDTELASDFETFNPVEDTVQAFELDPCSIEPPWTDFRPVLLFLILPLLPGLLIRYLWRLLCLHANRKKHRELELSRCQLEIDPLYVSGRGYHRLDSDTQWGDWDWLWSLIISLFVYLFLLILAS